MEKRTWMCLLWCENQDFAEKITYGISNDKTKKNLSTFSFFKFTYTHVHREAGLNIQYLTLESQMAIKKRLTPTKDF